MTRDSRQFERKSTTLGGHIYSPADSELDIVCDILDMSAGGAKLKTDKPVELSGQVSIEIGELGTYPATVIWSRPPQIGLKFLEPPEVMADVVMAVALYR